MSKNQSENMYEVDSPEWQLFEIVRGAEMAAKTATEDYERYFKKATECRDKAQRYRDAIEIIIESKK